MIPGESNQEFNFLLNFDKNKSKQKNGGKATSKKIKVEPTFIFQIK